MNKLKIIGSGFAFCLMFVAGWEGKELVAYRDIVGVPTACYGHTGPEVVVGEVYTDAECKALLETDLRQAWNYVDEQIVPPLKPWEHAAFASFVFNTGNQAFKQSTLRRLANEGNMPAACLQLLRWVYADGEVVQGLKNRRMAEFKLCIGEGVTQ